MPRGKKRFVKRTSKKGAGFWNAEYKQGAHLALSDAPSEDLVKFTTWLEAEYGRTYLNPLAAALDLGCGNGRNLMYLATQYGMRGAGYDISHEAVAQAARKAGDLPLSFTARSIASPLPIPDTSQTVVLDMMTSHFLNASERAQLTEEIVRVLKPDGWLFLKTFLRDEDEHAERLLRDYPAEEAGSYIHPEIGVAEHVFTEEEIVSTLESQFYIHKVVKSHRHRARAAKRRSITVYAQKI